MEKETVKTYDDVLESIAVFNKSLEKSKRFRDQVRFFQSWYYVPELDAVGPSKFVRYKGMTGFDYIRTYSALDGRVAEPVLAKWFVRLEDNSPEAVWVRQRVDQLLGHYGKTVGNMAKFSAPRGWSIEKHVETTPPANVQDLNQVDAADLVQDGIWHEFLTLSPEDQRDLADRINKYIR
jgi:hypothetical protein